ncbi:MAG: HPr family phosphocarrier protein [Rhodospirillaceae bacterium]|nr:HPr family phosphocarrier protein [Rhodospirillaceae bacterium]
MRGLHARAAAKFVKLASGFDAQVQVSNKDLMTVSGESIMGLLMLSAGPGCAIHLSAAGTEAEAALKALCDLVEAKFYED